MHTSKADLHTEQQTIRSISHHLCTTFSHFFHCLPLFSSLVFYCDSSHHLPFPFLLIYLFMHTIDMIRKILW